MTKKEAQQFVLRWRFAKAIELVERATSMTEKKTRLKECNRIAAEFGLGLKLYIKNHSEQIGPSLHWRPV
jgi:hypothetical protein